MTTTDASPLHARRCAVSTCANWTNHESGVCPRCRERGLFTPAVAPVRAIASISAEHITDPRDDFILEADVQAACLEVLDMLHWTVYRVGQYIAKATQDAGVSDLIAFKAGFGVVFIEVKRMRGGRQSEAQRGFQVACEAAGVRYILTNSSDHLFAQLVEMKRAGDDVTHSTQGDQ